MTLFSYVNPGDAKSELKDGDHLTRAPETARVRSICANQPTSWLLLLHAHRSERVDVHSKNSMQRPILYTSIPPFD
jgi:hypothetical protein